MAPYASPGEGYVCFLEFLFENDVPEELKTEGIVKRASVRQLVTEVNSTKTADELLEKYNGQEDKLIKNLSKMKLKQEENAEIIAEIKTLAVETNMPKSADEMLATYAGREEELLKNLRKMKLKQAKQAETIAEIKTLAVETGCAKSAEEMLQSYNGREEELLRNLRKLKLKQDKKSSTIDEIKTLMAESDIPKEKCDELFVKYDGKEDTLLKNMRKMSSGTVGTERMNSTGSAANPAADEPVKKENVVVVENMSGKDYQKLIKEKQRSARGLPPSGSSTKKMNYNDMIKEKKRQALAQQ